ncbi:MAG: YesL family protein [Lachnospirales bacterium]
MRDFLNYDGPLFAFLSKVADIIILSLLWLLCSLPIFTIGASTTACYYVFTKAVTGKSYYVVKDFFLQFKVNFIKATIIQLILFLVISISGLSIYSSYLLGLFDKYYGIVLIVIQIFFMFEIIIVTIYAFPVLSRFELKVIETFKTALALGNGHLLSTVELILLHVVLTYVTYRFFIFSMIYIGTYAFISSYIFVKIFRKHRPDFDEIINYDDYNNIIN